jgi:hypothetical protein
MVDDASVLFWVFSLEMNFCYPSLNLDCGYFPGKVQPPPILGGVSHTLALLPKPERQVSPQTGLLGGLWEVIRLPFCLPKADLLFQPEFLPVWQAELPIGSWAFLGSFVQLRLALQYARRGKSLCWTSRLVSGGSLSRWAWEAKSHNKEVKTLYSPNSRGAAINVRGISNRDAGHQGFLVSNIYSLAGSSSADSHPKAEPQEQRGSHLIYSCKQVAEAKSKV